jgi:hypothetical protein
MAAIAVADQDHALHPDCADLPPFLPKAIALGYNGANFTPESS